MFGWWENVGKQRKYIYIFLFWYVFWLYTWFWVFICLLGVWVLRKCGKVKRNRLFFFSFFVSDLFCSKKLEATENGPNRTDWNPVSSVSVFLPFGSVEESHFKPTEPIRLHPISYSIGFSQKKWKKKKKCQKISRKYLRSCDLQALSWNCGEFHQHSQLRQRAKPFLRHFSPTPLFVCFDFPFSGTTINK